jgi:ASC-1-like (ASCH) protein
MMYRKHLSQPWFDLIRDGRKTVEGRLDRDDYAVMMENDVIQFHNGDDSYSMKVIHTARYSTFHEMVTGEGLDHVLPGIGSIEEGVSIYRLFYSEEDETKYGIVAIHISVQ